MAAKPEWIQPGVRATLIWTDGEREFPGDPRLYEVAGPVLGEPPPTPFFVTAPLSEEKFAAQLYAAEIGIEALRDFLDRCRLVKGRLSEEYDLLIVMEETPLLPVLEEWGGEDGGERLGYEEEIEAFLSGDLVFHANPEAHRALQQSSEAFVRTWVCAGCGEAEDASNFLWTVHCGASIQARLAIQNMGGTWTFWLYPFQIEKSNV
jgi:hypothetical protein